MTNTAKTRADAELLKSGALTTDRIQSLGDNIFGFAMTLLVLNFLVPELGNGMSLGSELVTLVPAFLTYAMSFIVLGMMWVSQQNQYHFIQRSDRLFLWINIVFLMFVVFVPFSTHILSLYHTSALAVLLYGLNLIICGALLYWHWTYATENDRLVNTDIEKRVVQVIKIRYIFLIIWVGVSVALAYFSIPLAFFLFVPALMLGVRPTTIDRFSHWWLS